MKLMKLLFIAVLNPILIKLENIAGKYIEILIFLSCTKLKKIIGKYNFCRQWMNRFGQIMTVTVISSENCSSLGDAMRDLYSKALLKKDFILLSVDVIGNVNLKSLVHEHK